jgi:Winged helix DNA-binding domain
MAGAVQRDRRRPSGSIWSMTHPLTVDEALRARWHATGLPTQGRSAAASSGQEEVRRLGAVQAQEFEMTLWSLARRTSDSRERLLDQFARGDIVRTHTLRQTWHFVHRSDLEMVQAATAHRVHLSNVPLYREAGLDDRTLHNAAEVVLATLNDGPATRTELGARLGAVGLPSSGLGLGTIMMWAELECLVASGPLLGKQHTYVRWPGSGRRPPAEEAAATLAERYFASHGPAGLDDFMAWSSLTKTAVRAAVDGLPLERTVIDDVEYLWLGDLDLREWVSPQVELLNGYDEYISGLGPRAKRWLDLAHLARERPGTPIGVVMVDGQLAGHWRRRVTASQVEVEVLPLRQLTPEESAALDRNADAFGAFVGLPARVHGTCSR